jgi:hypothetical protein
MCMEALLLNMYSEIGFWASYTLWRFLTLRLWIFLSIWYFAEVTTVEGVIQRAISGLEQEQPFRSIRDPAMAVQIGEFLTKLQNLKSVKSPFTMVSKVLFNKRGYIELSSLKSCFVQQDLQCVDCGKNFNPILHKISKVLVIVMLWDSALQGWSITSCISNHGWNKKVYVILLICHEYDPFCRI